MSCGADCPDRKIETKPQVQSENPSPLPDLRAAPGVLPEIRPVPDLFSQSGIEGGDSGCHQVQLVEDLSLGGAKKWG